MGILFPEGTKVLTATWIDGTNEQRFSDAGSYHPERWMVHEI